MDGTPERTRIPPGRWQLIGYFISVQSSLGVTGPGKIYVLAPADVGQHSNGG